jgi:tyrosine-protein kinase Etk/Wzc
MNAHPSAAPMDLLAILTGRWKTLAVFAVLSVGGAIGYAYLARQWFAATLTVVPSQRSQDSAAMSLASKIPIGFDTVGTDVQRIQAVLTSNSVGDAVIDKFKLTERYQTTHREHARSELWSHCTTSADRKSSVVALSCEDTDPELAMQMATFFGEEGNRVFGRVSSSSAREERKFLEAQVTKARNDVDETSRKLREFQELHKVVDLPEQSKAVISAMASLKGEMLSKQLELSYLSSFSARTESSVVQLRQQISIMEAKLAQLESSSRSDVPAPATGSAAKPGSKVADFFPEAMNVPQLRFELEQLMREQKIQETLFFVLTQRFEMAKVDEARDTSTFQILDHPTLPTYRSRPNRRRLAMLGLVGGIVVGATWIIFPVWWRRRSFAGS